VANVWKSACINRFKPDFLLLKGDMMVPDFLLSTFEF
jgi:hypothetical protein